MLKKLITLALCFATASAFAATATYTLPAAGTGAGAAGSDWHTELILHNAGNQPLQATLTWHDQNGPGGVFTTTIDPRATQSFADVVATQLGVTSGTGAITVETDAVFAQKLAISARIFNRTSGGDLGQDVPALDSGAALTKGDTGIITGPTDIAASRFNFGIYAADASTVEWTLLRKDGTEAASVTKDYEAGTQIQYNGGVETLLDATAENDDVIHANVQSGRLFLYGSVVDQMSGDPTWVGAGRTRENLPVQFLGVDVNHDGIIDATDANGDGVLDQPVDVYTAFFPNFLRVLVADPEGQPVTLSIVSPTQDIRIVEDNLVQWYPGSILKGTSGKLVIAANDGTDTVNLTIPVNFK
ncbi:MAG: hypothetical protein WBX15_02280 [Thermoanaerobaculia bacterium]